MTDIHDDEQLRRDVESLHVLPLATLPLKTTILKRAPDQGRAAQYRRLPVQQQGNQGGRPRYRASDA
jgi:hypothetical protein